MVICQEFDTLPYKHKQSYEPIFLPIQMPAILLNVLQVGTKIFEFVHKSDMVPINCYYN